MKYKPFEPISDGRETERFHDLAKKLVSVPKAEIDRRLEVERQLKQERKDKKRKAYWFLFLPRFFCGKLASYLIVGQRFPSKTFAANRL